MAVYLSQAIRKLEGDNAKQSGHQNQHQKINYLLAVKRENNDLQKVTKIPHFRYSGWATMHKATEDEAPWK